MEDHNPIDLSLEWISDDEELGYEEEIFCQDLLDFFRQISRQDVMVENY